MPKIETTTPTTPAMPITTTLELPSRRGMLCRFMPTTAPICRKTLMVASLDLDTLNQRPASASTTLSVCTRRAGGSELTIATAADSAMPVQITLSGNDIPPAPIWR
jgi:hypothetical protein